MLFFGWLKPIHNKDWQAGELQGKMVSSTAQSTGTLLAFCGRHLYSAFFSPDYFVIIVSAVKTKRIMVQAEMEEKDGKLVPTGHLIRTTTRNKLEMMSEEVRQCSLHPNLGLRKNFTHDSGSPILRGKTKETKDKSNSTIRCHSFRSEEASSVFGSSESPSRAVSQICSSWENGDLRECSTANKDSAWIQAPSTNTSHSNSGSQRPHLKPLNLPARGTSAHSVISGASHDASPRARGYDFPKTLSLLSCDETIPEEGEANAYGRESIHLLEDRVPPPTALKTGVDDVKVKSQRQRRELPPPKRVFSGHCPYCGRSQEARAEDRSYLCTCKATQPTQDIPLSQQE